MCLSGDVHPHLVQPCYVALGQALIWGFYTYYTHPEQRVHYSEILINNYGYGNMLQAGIDPLVQSHASYEASALPPATMAGYLASVVFGLNFFGGKS